MKKKQKISLKDALVLGAILVFGVMLVVGNYSPKAQAEEGTRYTLSELGNIFNFFGGLLNNEVEEIELAGSTSDSWSVGGTFTATGASTLTGGVTVGSSGTAQTSQITTTCAPILDNSIAATSTGYGYCTGVTGVTSSYNVIASFATSTPVGDGWVQSTDNFWIVSAKASTTAGAIDLQIYNGTGAAKAPSALGARTGSTTAIHASY
jgi:hypothetical protein